MLNNLSKESELFNSQILQWKNKRFLIEPDITVGNWWNL